MSARQTKQIIEISRQPDSDSVVGSVGLLTTLTAAGVQASAIAAPPPGSRPGPSAGRRKANTQTAVNLKRTIAKVARGKDRARKKATMASFPSEFRQAATIAPPATPASALPSPSPPPKSPEAGLTRTPPSSTGTGPYEEGKIRREKGKTEEEKGEIGRGISISGGDKAKTGRRRGRVSREEESQTRPSNGAPPSSLPPPWPHQSSSPSA